MSSRPNGRAWVCKEQGEMGGTFLSAVGLDSEERWPSTGLPNCPSSGFHFLPQRVGQLGAAGSVRVAHSLRCLSSTVQWGGGGCGQEAEDGGLCTLQGGDGGTHVGCNLVVPWLVLL